MMESEIGAPAGLIVDIDGVVLNKERLIEQSDTALRILADSGIRVVYATNNSRMTPEQHVDRFRKLGIPSQPEQFITSSIVTAARLASLQSGTGKTLRAYVIGATGAMEGGLYTALEENGIAIAREGWQKDHWETGTEPTHVVVGFKPAFVLQEDGYPAVSAILDPEHPADFYATNDDAVYRSGSGTLLPANGFVVSGIVGSTGKQPVVMGKPHAPMLDEAVKRLGLPPDQIALVGDNIREDISGVATFNRTYGTRLRAFAVLTGVLTRDTLTRHDVPFDGLFPTLHELVKELRGR